jgi:hypothetical protein
MVKPGSDILKLNVGGQLKMSTTRDTLTKFKGSYLETAFNGAQPLKIVGNQVSQDEEIFLDRDPAAFE